MTKVIKSEVCFIQICSFIAEMNVLNELRSQMELLDLQLITMLSRRQELAFFIGVEKQRLKLNVEQLDYWNSCQDKRMFIAKKLELNDALVRDVYDIIHKHSKRTQEIKK